MNSVAFLLIPMFAFPLGFALARANSCTVASTRRLVIDRRPDWLIGLLVAVSWAAFVLISFAAVAPANFPFPAEVPLSASLFAGGALLGFGALLNRGCFLGSVSQLGRGNLNYLLTFVGRLSSSRR